MYMKNNYDRPLTEIVVVNTCAVMDEIIGEGSGQEFEANRSHFPFDDEAEVGKSPIWDDGEDSNQ